MHIRNVTIFALLLLSLAAGKSRHPIHSSDDDGVITVFVTYGDMDRTPASTAYVEASGVMRKDGSRKSFVLKSSKPGQYETSVPRGIYDVFVSEGTSRPQCSRLIVGAGLTATWKLQLKIDEEHLQN
jgi:hypothetical protein